MANISLKRSLWWFCVYLIQAGGVPSFIAPVRLPPGERDKLRQAAQEVDVLIVFNPGGWGDVSLAEADDFRPILEGIQATLRGMGLRSAVSVYLRTLPGLMGRLAGMKDQILSFRFSSRRQAADLEALATAFPQKRFLLVGFSTGGGLSSRSLQNLEQVEGLSGMSVGVPGWFTTVASPKSLVLNNSGKDPLVAGDIYSVTWHVVRAPYVWLKAHLKGERLSLPLAFHFPHHEYGWDSPEVGPPISAFLQRRLSGFAAFQRPPG
jgi:pimeloyl-ACP methyl ester carboxylesterase